MGAVYLSHAVISVGLKTGEGILKTGKTLTSTTIHGASDAVRMQKTSIYTDYGGENVSNGIAKNAGATLAQVTLGSERVANAAGNSVLYGYTKLARPGIQRWSAETRNKMDWAISKNTPFSSTFNVRARERAAIYARKQRTNRKKLEKYNRKRISVANTRRGAVKVASKSMNQQYRNLTSAVMGGNDITSKTGRLYAHGSRYAIKKTGKTVWKAGKGMWRSWKNRRSLFKGAAHGVALVANAISTAAASIAAAAVAASPAIVVATTVIAITSFVTLCTTFLTSMTNLDCKTGSEIPVCDKDNSIKALAYASQAWDPTSDQYEFWNCPNGGCSAYVNPAEGKTRYGELKVDDTGYYYYDFDGARYYCVALASYYTNHIGDKFSITTSEGKTYYVIVCDQKADVHTHAGNNADSDNCLSGDNDMVEFYVQRKVMANIEDWPNNINDELHPFHGAVTRMIKQDGGSEGCGTGGILEAEGVTIDFSKKYYNYSPDGITGNPCVCDANNNVAYPFSNCQGLSVIGKWNKMICSSYAAARYWEVNYPDDPFPLPLNWDQTIHYSVSPPGSGAWSTDVSHPIPKSIIALNLGGGTLHDAFIEGVADDGSIVVSEANYSTQFDQEFGWQCRKYESLEAFLSDHGAVLVGMYGP